MLFDSPIEFIGGVLIGNWSTIKSIIWFLPALFSLNLLYFFFEKSDKYIKYLIFGLSIITFIFASKVIVLHYNIPFGFDVGLYIFLLAYIVKYIYKHQEKFIGINLVLMIIAILVASISLFYYEPIKTHTEYHLRIDLAQFSVPITLIGYLSFILLNISILIVFLKIKEISLLTTVGNYSYPIFLFHSVILYKLPSLIKFDSLIINIIFLVSTFILSITLPIIGSKFIMRLSNNFKYIGMVK